MECKPNVPTSLPVFSGFEPIVTSPSFPCHSPFHKQEKSSQKQKRQLTSQGIVGIGAECIGIETYQENHLIKQFHLLNFDHRKHLSSPIIFQSSFSSPFAEGKEFNSIETTLSPQPCTCASYGGSCSCSCSDSNSNLNSNSNSSFSKKNLNKEIFPLIPISLSDKLKEISDLKLPKQQDHKLVLLNPKPLQFVNNELNSHYDPIKIHCGTPKNNKTNGTQSQMNFEIGDSASFLPTTWTNEGWKTNRNSTKNEKSTSQTNCVKEFSILDQIDKPINQTTRKRRLNAPKLKDNQQRIFEMGAFQFIKQNKKLNNQLNFNNILPRSSRNKKKNKKDLEVEVEEGVRVGVRVEEDLDLEVDLEVEAAEEIEI